MLALARHLGAARDSYLEPDHPVQQAILQTLCEMADLDADEVEVAVDGCTAPTFCLPLAAAATAFARLADPADLAGPRRQACQQITSAMSGHPDMVAGGSSFDTAFIRAGGGRWISKAGAEGYFAVAVRPGAGREGSPGLGIAAKVADGDAARRAGALLVLSVLQQLGVIADLMPELAEFGPRPLRNWNGRPAAGIRPSFQLARA
jgi:L-asparaginase II